MALQTLNYPANIGNQAAQGEHYMMIDSYESLNAINTGATKKSSIALYIPPGSMKTGFSANYEGMEGGALKAASVTGAKRLAGAENPIDAMVANIGGAFREPQLRWKEKWQGWLIRQDLFLLEWVLR